MKIFLWMSMLLSSSFFMRGQGQVEVKSVFWGSRLVDQQTSVVLSYKSLKFNILHRFGTIGNGFEDLLGVYAPSNISMCIAYGLYPRLMVEFQTEKNYKTQELGLKYNILKQDVDHKMPIHLSYYFNIALDARKEEVFGNDFSPIDRLFFTNQLIASHQFRYKYNLMLAVRYVHFNKTPTQVQNDKMELNMALGYKLSRKRSIFVNYQQPWDISWFSRMEGATVKPKSALALGYESSSYSHNFQVFLTTRDHIIVGKDQIYNQNSIGLENLRLGFNISVRILGGEDIRKK